MQSSIKNGILVLYVGLFVGCGTPAIIKAIQSNDIQKVKSEVEKGNVNDADGYAWSPLHHAILYENLDLVKYLIQNGADIHAKDDWGDAPIHRSAKGRNVEILKLIHELGAKIDTKGNYNATPLYQAVRYNQINNVKYLIEHGANVNAISRWRDNTAISRAESVDVAKYLVEHGANINSQDALGETPLHSASSNGAVDVVMYLIEQGADTSIRTNLGKTYLDVASPETKAKLIAMQKDIQRQKELDLQTQQQNKLKDEINSLITKQDFEGLKNLTEANPNYVNYIANDELRLMLTGPKGMKVGDIMKLLQNGKSESIVISLIKRVQVPYKEFTLDEIDILLKMGLTDKTVSAMIDTTTEILKDDKKRKEQESYLAEQKKVSEQKTQTQVIYQTVENNSNNQSNGVVDTLKDEAVKELGKQLFKKLF